MREEAKQLINEMLRFEMSGIPIHQVVIGSKGSGKMQRAEGKCATWRGKK